ncbi:MAG: hypothetical protein RLZZ326_569 [Planctomycetota bacterium]
MALEEARDQGRAGVSKSLTRSGPNPPAAMADSKTSREASLRLRAEAMPRQEDRLLPRHTLLPLLGR